MQTSRRRFIFLAGTGMLTGKSLFANETASDRVIGQAAKDEYYGQPSRHTKLVRKLISEDGYTGSSITPLSQLYGAVTPSGLHFERHHGGIPDIEPQGHRLSVSGKRRKRQFSLNDLKRYPQKTVPAFIECSGNSDECWKDSPTLHTVDEIHGMTSQSFWSGVSMSWILEAMNAPREKAWIIAVGKDAPSLARSIPVEKCWDSGLLAYGQNGEALRPEQGYPLRLILPGWEGNCQIKWLSRLELSDRPAFSYQETAKYSDLYRDGKARLFTFVMGTKSIIVSPSGGMKLPGKGYCEIRGLAWSGQGKIVRVEVSADGGRTYADAVLEEPILPHSHTPFFFPWHWKGETAVIQSRATNSEGEQQPSRQNIIRERGKNSYYHFHGIQSWRVTRHGQVENYHAHA